MHITLRYFFSGSFRGPYLLPHSLSRSWCPIVMSRFGISCTLIFASFYIIFVVTSRHLCCFLVCHPPHHTHTHTVQQRQPPTGSKPIARTLFFLLLFPFFFLSFFLYRTHHRHHEHSSVSRHYRLSHRPAYRPAVLRLEEGSNFVQSSSPYPSATPFTNRFPLMSPNVRLLTTILLISRLPTNRS